VSKKLTTIPTLADCTIGLRDEATNLNGLAKKATYRAIAIGLWAMKAQELFRCGPSENQGRKSGKFTDSATVAQSAIDSFDAWLQTATEGFISRRTAYNYLNAAANAGLTADSTLEEVAEMEQRDALNGRSLTAHDLYSPPRLGDSESPTKPPRAPEPGEKAQQAWFPFYEQLAFYSTDEKEADLLYHLPLTTVDPTKEVSLQDLEQNLEHALARVREIKAERQASARTARRGGAVIDA
jgi:hypothetical protein